MRLLRQGRIGRSVILAAIGGLAVATGWTLVCPGQTASSRPASQPASQPRAVTQAEFVKVMQQSCVRCHRQQCSSVAALKKARWLTPGKPEASPVFTIIGRGNGANSYHKLTETDKNTVRDFIKQMQS